MTLVLAIRGEEEIHLVADTAVTRPGAPEDDYSLLGQLQRRDGKAVEEALLKIVRIDDGLVVAFAGNVRSAFDLIQLVADRRRLGFGVHEIFAAAAQLPSRAEGVEVAVATNDDGAARLFYWRTGSSLRPVPFLGRPIAIELGSLRDQAHLFVEDALRFMEARKVSGERALVLLCAHAHHLSARNDYVARGVGGAFIGASMTSDGFRWQPDIAYLFLSTSYIRRMSGGAADASAGNELSAMPGIVCTIARDPFVIVASPSQGHQKWLFNEVTCRGKADVTAALSDEVDATLRHVRARYYSFVNVQDPILIIGHTKTASPVGPAFSIRPEDASKRYHFTLAPALVHDLTTIHRDEHGTPIPSIVIGSLDPQ